MKKIILSVFCLFAIGVGNAQTVHTDGSQMVYVNVSPYLANHKDVDSVYTMYIIDKKDNGSSAGITYELRSSSGSVLERGYYTLDGTNYQTWASYSYSYVELFNLLSMLYTKNTIK